MVGSDLFRDKQGQRRSHSVFMLYIICTFLKAVCFILWLIVEIVETKADYGALQMEK